MDVVNTAQNRGSQLRAERIPHAVFDLCGGTVSASGAIDGNAFLAIHILSGGRVKCDKSIFLASGNKDTFVSMRLNHNLELKKDERRELII
jgi:hypothetical protein